MSKKVIIIGASAGIGRALALAMSKAGYEVGITARRKELLDSLQTEMPNKSFVKVMDIGQAEVARTQLAELVAEMGGMDMLVLNSAVGHGFLKWETDKEMIMVNTLGSVALGDWAIDFFKKQEKGHLVGISSVAMHRAFREAIVYSATKSFLSAYLQGVRHYFVHKKGNFAVTDIRPGFVETFMTSQNDPDKMFWLTKADEAADYILSAIEKKKKIAYISPRWWIMGKIMGLMPDWLAHKM